VPEGFRLASPNRAISLDRSELREVTDQAEGQAWTQSKASVMVVGDSASLCKSMTFVLNNKGHTASMARDRSEAIAKVAEQPLN